MKPGETDPDKKTVSFDIFDSAGLPASGLGGEGAVATFATTELQISSNYGSSYTTALGTFAHGGDGIYKYQFTNAEVQTSVGEKNLWLRYKKAGFKTRVVEVDLRFVAVDSLATNSVDANALKADAVTEIQAGLATAAAQTTLQTTANDLHKVAFGRWKIIGTQLILYDVDGVTPIVTFNLKDDLGAASNIRIFERVPV